VGDSRREHLEIREPLGPLPLDFERFQRREIAEHRDGAQDGAGLVVQRRRRADDQPGRHAIRQLSLGLSSGSTAHDGLGKHSAHARRQHTERLESHALDRQPGELLRRAVEERDLAGCVDGHHAALDGGDDVVQMLVGQQHLCVQLRVLHRDPGLVGQRHQQIEILRIERITREFGPDHDSPDDVRLRHQRQHEGPVQPRQRRMQSLALAGRPLVRDLVVSSRSLVWSSASMISSGASVGVSNWLCA
jgi:hypothetical protein